MHKHISKIICLLPKGHDFFDGHELNRINYKTTRTTNTYIASRNEDIGRDRAGNHDGSVVKTPSRAAVFVAVGAPGSAGGRDPCAVGAPRTGPERCPA